MWKIYPGPCAVEVNLGAGSALTSYTTCENTDTL